MEANTPLHAPAGSLTIDRIIEALNEGQQVIFEQEIDGETHETVRQITGPIKECVVENERSYARSLL